MASEAARECDLKNLFAIWSDEHNAWWAPDREGYVSSLARAGLYTEAEADEICRSRTESKIRAADHKHVVTLSDDWMRALTREKELGDGE